MTKGGGGVGEMMILVDQRGGGVWIPPFFPDIICEQPLLSRMMFMVLNKVVELLLLSSALFVHIF